MILVLEVFYKFIYPQTHNSPKKERQLLLLYGEAITISANVSTSIYHSFNVIYWVIIYVQNHNNITTGMETGLSARPKFKFVGW
jgi:hypothetical protein